MNKILTPEQIAITEQFQAHIDAEIRGDLDTTLSTMTSSPHLNNIPTMIGGIGKEGVKNFYASTNWLMKLSLNLLILQRLAGCYPIYHLREKE
jgi:hypothetical protein